MKQWRDILYCEYVFQKLTYKLLVLIKRATIFCKNIFMNNRNVPIQFYRVRDLIRLFHIWHQLLQMERHILDYEERDILYNFVHTHTQKGT